MKVKARFAQSLINANAELTSLIPVQADFATTLHITTAEDYMGDYEVTSFCADPLLTTSIILPTNDKHMLDDVTIYSVPTSEEQNSAGGVTFTIGG